MTTARTAVGLAAAFALLPWLVADYHRLFAAEILVWGLLAMSFGLVYGYGGMLSFAQAVFFGWGCWGYNVASFLLQWNTWGALGLAMVAAAAFAVRFDRTGGRPLADLVDHVSAVVLSQTDYVAEADHHRSLQQHLDGINRSCLGRRKGIGAATVQRYFLRRLQRRARQVHAPVCPRILGIDEHFFSRRKGYATTFCDLKNHRIYDVALGRSEAALDSYFLHLQGKGHEA